MITTPTIDKLSVDELGYSMMFDGEEMYEKLITGEPAIRQWFELMLRQRPGLTPIYNYEYNRPGIDIIKLYELPYHIMTAEIQRHIEITAAYNPVVNRVAEFQFTRSGRTLMVSFTAYLNNGEEVEIIYDV